MKKQLLFIIGAVTILSLLGCEGEAAQRIEQVYPGSSLTQRIDDAAKISAAFRNRQSKFFVESNGVVQRLLKDDLEGDRHQRWIVRLDSGQTLLISHNIDLAPRINALAVNDRVYFRGEYIWNDKGGLIHWTHHDPSGRYPGGWIEHNGKQYR